MWNANKNTKMNTKMNTNGKKLKPEEIMPGDYVRFMAYKNNSVEELLRQNKQGEPKPISYTTQVTLKNISQCENYYYAIPISFKFLVDNFTRYSAPNAWRFPIEIRNDEHYTIRELSNGVYGFFCNNVNVFEFRYVHELQHALRLVGHAEFANRLNGLEDESEAY